MSHLSPNVIPCSTPETELLPPHFPEELLRPRGLALVPTRAWPCASHAAACPMWTVWDLPLTRIPLLSAALALPPSQG